MTILRIFKTGDGCADSRCETCTRISFARVGSTLMLAVGLAGCALQQGRPAPTEADFATITPGMTREEVVARFGPPTWSFAVRQENLTIMNYRYNRNDCTIYQVSVRPDGTVRDASQGIDPACDRPRRRF